MANWSAQEVGLKLQVFPFNLFTISSTVKPLQRVEIAFKFPLQPP